MGDVTGLPDMKEAANWGRLSEEPQRPIHEKKATKNRTNTAPIAALQVSANPLSRHEPLTKAPQEHEDYDQGPKPIGPKHFPKSIWMNTGHCVDHRRKEKRRAPERHPKLYDDYLDARRFEAVHSGPP
jgi:hypothetical protein